MVCSEHHDARERKLGHAAAEAKLGGFFWTADALEVAAEKEQIKRRIAAEKALDEMQRHADSGTCIFCPPSLCKIQACARSVLSSTPAHILIT